MTLVAITVTRGWDMPATLREIDDLDEMKTCTHVDCQICGQPFGDDDDPDSLWFGIMVSRQLNTVVVMPLHRACTEGMVDDEAVEAAMIKGMQHHVPSLKLQEPLKERELEVIISPSMQAQVDAMEAEQPGVKAALVEFTANLRQAQHAVNEGRYESLADALEAITGVRPVLLPESELDDDEE